MEKKEPAREGRNKRLSVEVPTSVHNQLKYLGIVHNCSMRKLVMRALMAFIKHQEKYN